MPVLKQAVALRQQRKMSLGDSIISATALLNDLTLITANTADFRWIENIKLLDPLLEQN
jgi:predicted nucleic acid-binding protein